MKYKTMAKQLISDIQSQQLTLGEKMPSLRQISSLFNVSMTTSLNCYHYLEETGWLMVKPQSGFYVSSPMSLGPTPKSPQFEAKVITHSDYRADHRETLVEWQSSPLGISKLDANIVPVETIQRCITRGLKRLGSEFCNYNEPQGDLRLRTALSHHFESYQFHIPAEELVLTSGCMHAVRLAIEVTTNHSDAIAISSPCFSGLLKLLAQMGRSIVEIPSTEDGLDLDQLEYHMQNKTIRACLISTSHMNPQGISLTNNQKQRIAQMASRYEIPIIEDDVYAELGFNRHTPLPAKHWDEQGYILWCSSFSKSVAPGLRTGWCSPGRYLSDYIKAIDSHSLGSSPIVQRGLADFIATGQYQRHLNKARNKIFANICAYRSVLIEHLPAGSAVSRPNGGLVLWIQVPGLHLENFKLDCEQENLDVRFGDVFSSRDDYLDYFRINAGWHIDEQQTLNRSIRQALIKLCELANQNNTRN